MKKKAAASFICLMMVFGLASCGSSVSYDSYDLGEYLKVGEYKGLPVSDYTVSVTDDEVQTQIQSTLEAAATTQELDKETALADGDTVNIDYVGAPRKDMILRWGADRSSMGSSRALWGNM